LSFNIFDQADAIDAIPYVDEIIREYLLFCGLTKTLTAFESERKHDKIKGYQVYHLLSLLFFLSFTFAFTFAFALSPLRREEGVIK
jgi:hypothetical protein